MAIDEVEKVSNEKTYDVPVKGFSLFSGDPVTIIGEQTVERNGKLLEQYLYHIDGYIAKNGLPFVALKCNLVTL